MREGASDQNKLSGFCWNDRSRMLENLVGAAGFEPATPSPPDWCANRAALRSEERHAVRRRLGARKGRGGANCGEALQFGARTCSSQHRATYRSRGGLSSDEFR